MDIGVKDSFIAGICEAHNLPLLTRNIKHFNRIPNLKLISLE
ncbi:MAG: type II toxin-antitoxin system VapC family toxin [Deltaproteobacteria bacterium]|nr:type II toxin-antitoxin system VapC family toxin [Deltaproteobacteria bacterium]